MYQNFEFGGRVGGVPERNTLPSGKEVVNFSVAVKDQRLEDHEKPLWVRVAVWDWNEALQQRCMDWLTAGSRVLVTGRINYDKEVGGIRAYEDKNGEPRASLDVTANKIVFWDSAAETAALVGDGGPVAPPAPVEADDIPF